MTPRASNVNYLLLKACDWRFVDVALHQLIWPENEKRVFHFIEQNPMIQDNFSALDFLAAHRENLLVVITKRARRENDYW